MILILVSAICIQHHGVLAKFDNWFCTRNVNIKFPNSVDPDEVAHHEPPHLYLPCLPSVL